LFLQIGSGTPFRRVPPEKKALETTIYKEFRYNCINIIVHCRGYSPIIGDVVWEIRVIAYVAVQKGNSVIATAD
jgi:hypothetical protein